MNLITSVEDGRMKRFQGYKDGGGVGFVGYELLLFSSLVAAFTRIGELECQKNALQQVYEDKKPTGEGESGETGDESTG